MQMRHFRVLVALAGRALPRSPNEKEGATARFSEASSRLTARSQLVSREDALMLLKFLMDPYQVRSADSGVATAKKTFQRFNYLFSGILGARAGAPRAGGSARHMVFTDNGK